eukprot:COSAG01_NODE_1467_length_10217_cov_33.824570_7_plen_81_part_00
MLGGFTRSLSALVHFTLHTGAGVDSVVYNEINGQIHCGLSTDDFFVPPTAPAPALRANAAGAGAGAAGDRDIHVILGARW